MQTTADRAFSYFVNLYREGRGSVVNSKGRNLETRLWPIQLSYVNLSNANTNPITLTIIE